MKISKYKNIEYSEVWLSELEESIRIDSEFFDSLYFNRENLIKGKNNKKLKEIADNSWNTFSKSLNEIKYIEISNVDIENADYKFENVISKNAPSRAKKLVSYKDVLISTVRPNRNAVTIIKEKENNIVCSTGFCKLKVKSILPEYIFILFKTNIYRDFLVRYTTASMYPAVQERDIMKQSIPIPSESFQKEIESLVLKSYELKNKSEKLYQEADNILIEELGLENWKPKTRKFKLGGKEFEVEDSISEVYFSKAVKNWRFDSEHWEPQYEDIIKKFKRFKTIKLGSLVSYPISSGATPKAGGDDYIDDGSGFPFLRAVDLVDGRVNASDLLYIKDKIHYGMLKRTQLKKEDVLFSIAGTVGRTAIFNHPFEANINQALSIIRIPNEKIVCRLYLVVLFNSYIGKKIVSKTARQGLQTNLSLAEVASLEIPIIEYQIQKKISNKIKEFFDLKDYSKNLLEISKRAVEIFIEQDEKAALKFIKENKDK